MIRSTAILVFSWLLGTLTLTGTSADARSRFKDLAEFEGVRDNMVEGYGRVVGG
jgi:flagellar P-ring protein precursor FlgI